MEIFLAQLLGLYFIIVGAVVLVRRKSLMPAIDAMAANRPVLILLGVVELAAGLALAIVFPTVSLSVEGIISLVGYIMIAESITYLAAPSRSVRQIVRSFNTQAWYIAGGLLAILGGVYLAGTGFGIL